MPEFVLEPMPEPLDCHWVDGKTSGSRVRVHFAEPSAVLVRTEQHGDRFVQHGWIGRTLCGKRGELTDVGEATGPRCGSCVKAKRSAARVKRVAR